MVAPVFDCLCALFVAFTLVGWTYQIRVWLLLPFANGVNNVI